MAVLGVDTGGTFTDFVLCSNGAVQIHKVLSTPSAPEQAILQGIRELGLDAQLAEGALRIVHGTTVATNAALEGQGAPTLYVTNQGLEDVLAIGRQTRSHLYDLTPPAPDRPFAQAPTVGVGARRDAGGAELVPLSAADVSRVRAAIHDSGARSVAICLLFSWLDAGHEQALARALADLPVSLTLSSDLLPVSGEFERGLATWLNGWLGPKVSEYIHRLQAALPGVPLAIMQSSGGTLSADQAAGRAVNLLLSGPAGGLTAALRVGDVVGQRGLMTFDMGGTSTDVALLDGQLQLTQAGRIREFPVAVPMVDMHTIGAGGGSLATVDAAGMLQVGPASAGADPGPACYGRGGRGATVTDANLVLGRLPATSALGGSLSLDAGAAMAALARLGRTMGLSATDAARGVLALANEHMAQALRVISIQRGHDPSDYTLVSFGGAGGLHVCELAEALAMRRALVPANSGVLSAQGLVWAQPQREQVRSLPAGVTDADVARLAAMMRSEGEAALCSDGFAAAVLEPHTEIALRYEGQGDTLMMPWTGSLEMAREAFHGLHERVNGHRLMLPVEAVRLRVQVRAPGLAVPAPAAPASIGQPVSHVAVEGFASVPVFARDTLGRDQAIIGPAIITEAVATTWLAPGWQLHVHAQGHLLLERA